VSHHLVLLQKAGLVLSLQSGRNVLYTIDRKTFLALGQLFLSCGDSTYGNADRIGTTSPEDPPMG
jgi:DNA-binding transcriptional ArsR family regulator